MAVSLAGRKQIITTPAVPEARRHVEGPRHIREYQAELFQKQKLSPGTVSIRLAALRFFYIKTLKKARSIAETPYPKRALHFPSILSQEEVTRLIDSALTPYHRILLMTLYATGVRNAELTHLKVSDIDSKRMVPISRITGEVKSAYPINQGTTMDLGSNGPFSKAILRVERENPDGNERPVFIGRTILLAAGNCLICLDEA